MASRKRERQSSNREVDGIQYIFPLCYGANVLIFWLCCVHHSSKSYMHISSKSHLYIYIYICTVFFFLLLASYVFTLIIFFTTCRNDISVDFGTTIFARTLAASKTLGIAADLFACLN